MDKFNLDGEIFKFSSEDKQPEWGVFRVLNSMGVEHILIPPSFIHPKGFVSSLSFSNSLYLGLKLLTNMYHIDLDIDLVPCAGQQVLIMNNRVKYYEKFVRSSDSEKYYDDFLRKYGQNNFGENSIFKYCIGLQYFCSHLQKELHQISGKNLTFLKEKLGVVKIGDESEKFFTSGYL